MTLETLLAEINSTGWLVNYFRQHTADSWEAHLRNPTITAEERADGYHFTVSFGRGTTALEALTTAWEMGELRLEKLSTYKNVGIEKPSLSLTNLGFLQPAEPIRRRF